jgi:hypothetical protein
MTGQRSDGVRHPLKTNACTGDSTRACTRDSTGACTRFAIALAIGQAECVKRPDSFAEDVMTDWSLWVLDNGLPKLPDRVEVGESVPVARWVGARFAAVLHVQWRWGDSEEDDVLISETEVFARREGGWEISSGSGGTNWFDPPFVRPQLIGPRDAYAGGEHCSGGAG